MKVWHDLTLSLCVRALPPDWVQRLKLMQNSWEVVMETWIPLGYAVTAPSPEAGVTPSNRLAPTTAPRSTFSPPLGSAAILCHHFSLSNDPIVKPLVCVYVWVQADEDTPCPQSHTQSTWPRQPHSHLHGYSNLSQQLGVTPETSRWDSHVLSCLFFALYLLIKPNTSMTSFWQSVCPIYLHLNSNVAGVKDGIFFFKYKLSNQSSLISQSLLQYLNEDSQAERELVFNPTLTTFSS